MVQDSFQAEWTRKYSSGFVSFHRNQEHLLIHALLQNLDGKVTHTLAHSSSRVLDLAVTPDGKQLVAVGRGEVVANLLPSPDRSSSAPGSRSETPASSSTPFLAKHEKRISVFNIANLKLELYVSSPHRFWRDLTQ